APAEPAPGPSPARPEPPRPPNRPASLRWKSLTMASRLAGPLLPPGRQRSPLFPSSHAIVLRLPTHVGSGQILAAAKLVPALRRQLHRQGPPPGRVGLLGPNGPPVEKLRSDPALLRTELQAPGDPAAERLPPNGLAQPVEPLAGQRRNADRGLAAVAKISKALVRGQIDLIVHLDSRHLSRPDFRQHGLNLPHPVRVMRVARVDHVQQQA